MSMTKLRPKRWTDDDGSYPTPKRCPMCRSRRVVLAIYGDHDDPDEIDVECEGCNTVIYHYLWFDSVTGVRLPPG